MTPLFFVGVLCGVVCVLLIGLIDVLISRNRFVGTDLSNWRGYVLASAWELSFFGAGIFLGKVLFK